jgi:hypothetical protein
MNKNLNSDFLRIHHILGPANLHSKKGCAIFNIKCVDLAARD